MIAKATFALRVVAALVFVLFCRVAGIPVGLSGQRLVKQATHAARRSARPRRYAGQVNLRQQRAWFAVSKISSMNDLFAQIYEDAIFVAREQNLFANLVTGYRATGMATRYLPIYPSLTAQETAEGVDYSNATEWTKTQQMALVPKIVKTQTILTDERIATDPDSARSDAAIEMGGAIATKIDTDLAALMSNFDNTIGAAGSALTVKKCAAAMSILQASKVRGMLSFALHPYGWYDIWVELGQPQTNNAFLGETANQALRDYAVGRFIGANWYVSANIAVDASDDADSGVFAREALALDMRTATEFEPERDASLAGWEINARARYAVGVRRAGYGVTLTHDAATPTGA